MDAIFWQIFSFNLISIGFCKCAALGFCAKCGTMMICAYLRQLYASELKGPNRHKLILYRFSSILPVSTNFLDHFRIDALFQWRNPRILLNLLQAAVAEILFL